MCVVNRSSRAWNVNNSRVLQTEIEMVPKLNVIFRRLKSSPMNKYIDTTWSIGALFIRQIHFLFRAGLVRENMGESPSESEGAIKHTAYTWSRESIGGAWAGITEEQLVVQHLRYYICKNVSMSCLINAVINLWCNAPHEKKKGGGGGCTVIFCFHYSVGIHVHKGTTSREAVYAHKIGMRGWGWLRLFFVSTPYPSRLRLPGQGKLRLCGIYRVEGWKLTSCNH